MVILNLMKIPSPLWIIPQEVYMIQIQNLRSLILILNVIRHPAFGGILPIFKDRSRLNILPRYLRVNTAFSNFTNP